MKSLLIDLDDIRCTKPFVMWDKQKISRLTTAIINTGMLLRPLILNKDKEVLSGFMEYWAAVKANHIDPFVCKEVMVIIVTPSEERDVASQLEGLFATAACEDNYRRYLKKQKTTV